MTENNGPSFVDVAYVLFDPEGQLRPAAREVLTVYGFIPPTPVPVTERQPKDTDCDEEGRCLAFDGYWWCVSKDHLAGFTHWLPHWALPMPRTGGA